MAMLFRITVQHVESKWQFSFLRELKPADAGYDTSMIREAGEIWQIGNKLQLDLENQKFRLVSIEEVREPPSGGAHFKV